jgi:thioredoxin 1
MATTTVTAGNFKSLVSKPGIVILDWWAPWCGPCKRFAPIFEAAALKHPEITWGKVNTEEEPSLAGAFNIRSIPTLMAFRDGVLLFEQPGMLPPQGVEKLVAELQKIDMGEVRRKIDQQRAQQVAR